MKPGRIDFSKEDRDKVHDVMNLLQEQGAVDDLGIGIIRDAFANYFFLVHQQYRQELSIF